MNGALWMKGICLIWSRGRHFSPSLPDRGPTQGRGPTGIWHLAHSISDPRAEISGILVMVRRSSSSSRGTTYWFQIFCFSTSRVFRLRMCKFSERKCYPIPESSILWPAGRKARSLFKSEKGQIWLVSFPDILPEVSFCGKIQPCKSCRLYWKNPAYFRKTGSLSVGLIYRDYFMESERVRDFHTSWWSIWNRTSERSEQVRFLILHQRGWKSRTKRLPCCNLFILYILRFSHPQKYILALDKNYE